MLSAQNRLKTRSEKGFFNNCRVYKFNSFICFYQPGINIIKIAIRVKKSSGRNAVQRHALKRKITNYLRTKIDSNPIFGRLLVVTNKDCDILNWPQIKQDIDSFWQAQVETRTQSE